MNITRLTLLLREEGVKKCPPLSALRTQGRSVLSNEISALGKKANENALG